MGNICTKSGQMQHHFRLIICTITQKGYLIIPVFQVIGNNPDCNTSFCGCAQKKHRHLSSPPVFLLSLRGNGFPPGITHKNSQKYVPAGQWIPACAGMTKNEDGARYGYDESVSGARCAGMTRVWVGPDVRE